MKTIRLTFYSLFAILLLGWTTPIFTQSPQHIEHAELDAEALAQVEAVQQRMREAQRAAMRSPAMQQSQRDSVKRMMNTFWEGDSMNILVMRFLQQEDFRKGLGVTEEQFQNVQNLSSKLHEDPVVKSYQEKMSKLSMEAFGENPSEA